MEYDPICSPIDGPERSARLQLAMVPGIGSILFQRLLRLAGSAREVHRLGPSKWGAVSGVGPISGRQFAERLAAVDLQAIVQDCENSGVSTIVWGDPEYPRRLQEIPDPPPALFYQGRLDCLKRPSIAVVGSRHMTSYGQRLTRKLTEDLTRAGLVVVSGLARGVDRVAHQAVVESQGVTVAVMGAGHARIYPREHAELAEAITRNGLLLSEYPPSAPVKSTHFPQRNRIISGLALGVVVIEAAERSGALITARLAVEQNRDVFAVPGSVEHRSSRGCHRLIKSGAKLVETVDDILDELGPLSDVDGIVESRPSDSPKRRKLSEEEARVMAVLSPEPTTVDEVIHRTGIPAQRVLATLFVLEEEGLAERPSGGQVRRATGFEYNVCLGGAAINARGPGGQGRGHSRPSGCRPGHSCRRRHAGR